MDKPGCSYFSSDDEVIIHCYTVSVVYLRLINSFFLGRKFYDSI